MSIDPIKNDQQIVAPKAKEAIERKYYDEYASGQEEKVGNKKSDKLEVSLEARKLQPILTKINEGFYNKPETLIETALKIDTQLPSQKKA